MKFPLIGQHDSYTAFAAYLVVLLSIWKRPVRIGALTLLAAYVAFLILVPLSKWAFVLFKIIAWTGFYIHFFLVAWGYAGIGIEFLADLEGKIAFLAGETDR
ncbi:hypothetical protein HGRIS_014026 [Hohenbuehelia grisea]|uniref:Uncharacterized protein n=1 Tax=Hohenbuehelia grisea TaxID=104357 RepID=A0ABR3JSB0_9AGAR